MASEAAQPDAGLWSAGNAFADPPPPYDSLSGRNEGPFVVIDLDTPTDPPPPYSAGPLSSVPIPPTSSGEGEASERGRSRQAAQRAARRARRRAERRAQRRSFGPGGLLATPLFLPETRLVAPPDITRDLLSGLPTYAEAMSDHPPTYATVMAVRSTEQPSGALAPDDQRRTQNSGAWRPPRVNSRELYRAQRAARGSSDHAPYRRQGCCGVVGRHAVFGVVAIVVVIILVFLWR
uniref:UL56 n=1 Tax=Human herpesvirus 1 TaxID=10298 RepID=A0A2U9A3Q1_HHV1|nr:UL56 [Human alphaherpesvirus 1]AWO70507.1 UL56 [Human alphaherpesvirus 1]